MAPKLEDFEILEVIGTGSFSVVYHAVHKLSGRHVALKRLFWNNAPEKIIKEVNFMREINKYGKTNNIVRVLSLFRDFDQTTIVMEYIPHTSFRSFLPTITSKMIKDYMTGLLTALAAVHEQKLIHRDVKPANFLFNPNTGKGCLIDFGLSQQDLHLESYKNDYFSCISMMPQTPASANCNGGQDADTDDNILDLTNPEKCQTKPKMIVNRSGTRGFRAPEVLMAAFNQTPKIDIWSAGVILLSMLSQRYPFFRAPEDLKSLLEISTIIGTKRLSEAAQECGRVIRFPNHSRGVDLKVLCTQLNCNLPNLQINDSVFDLLKKMLEPVPSKRISAKEALAHPFLSC